MPYTTQTEIEAVLPANVAADLGLAAPDFDVAIAHASATADAYLAARYAVPLASPPEVVRACATDLAAWRVLCKGPQRSDEFLIFRQKAEDWMEWLRGVAAGRFSLPDTAGAKSGAAVVTNNDTAPVHFNDKALGGYFDKPARAGEEPG